MEPVTSTVVETFLQQLSRRFPRPATFYLLGGCALYLLGSPRETRDIDYTVELSPESLDQFRTVLIDLAAEMHLDLENVPLAEFIPLPPQAHERRRLVYQFGQLDVYIFDLYSIALSKIARGFESDIEDVIFMLRNDLIEFGELEQHFQIILPQAHKVDIDPEEFLAYFNEIRRRQRSL